MADPNGGGATTAAAAAGAADGDAEAAGRRTTGTIHDFRQRESDSGNRHPPHEPAPTHKNKRVGFQNWSREATQILVSQRGAATNGSFETT